jgi:molybdate transport system ATP-binding protein
MIRISISKELSMAEGKKCLSIDTSIETGLITTIFGRSGAGKTSLLRIVAGLLKPEAGTIISDNAIWLDTEKNINLPVQKRNVGFVFQDLALFPNMSVIENLRYGARDKRHEQDIGQLLKMVNLEGLAGRKPDTLSGGQRQRVALCRALVGRPRLLLLDEPFSSLDAEMHSQLREDLLRLHRTFDLTTILVTHDLGDVYSLSERTIVIDGGSVVRSGRPNEVFRSEESPGTMQLQGEILQISDNGVVAIAEILSGNRIIKVLIGEEEKLELRPGMQVLVHSSSFEPVITILGR